MLAKQLSMKVHHNIIGPHMLQKEIQAIKDRQHVETWKNIPLVLVESHRDIFVYLDLLERFIFGLSNRLENQ